MNRTWHTTALAALTVWVSGCVMVQSTPEGSAGQRRGLIYMLPKALLPVQLLAADGVLVLRVMPAKLIGDPAHRYFLESPVNPFSTDDMTLGVDANGLLSSVTATSTDKSLDVLTALFKLRAAPRAELGPAGSEILLFEGVFDPDGGTNSQENRNLISGLQRSLYQSISQWSKACEKDKTDQQKCTTAEKLFAPLKKVKDADPKASEAPEGVVIVKAEPLQVTKAAGAASGSGTSQAVADCSLGICHRSLQPYVVTLKILDVFEQSTVVTLPGGDPVVLPLDRAAFVRTDHTVTMQNGQITSVHTVRPSSALALVSWPLDVYRAVLTSTAELIQLRIGANTNEVNLAQSQLDTAQALKRIAAGMEALKNPTPESSPPIVGLTGPSRGNALLAVEFGQRKRVESTGQQGGQGGGKAGLGVIVPQSVDGKPGNPGPVVSPIAN